MKCLRGQKQMAAAVLVATVALTGCGGTSGSNSDNKNTASASPIKIGVVTSLTGVIGEYGVEWRRGFNIGLEYATGGTNKVDGHPIQVEFKDDGGIQTWP